MLNVAPNGGGGGGGGGGGIPAGNAELCGIPVSVCKYPVRPSMNGHVPFV